MSLNINMYLNIINNITYESKRKSKKNNTLKSQEPNNDEVIVSETVIKDYDNSYYSIFYGDLTKNWIKLNYKKI